MCLALHIPSLEFAIEIFTVLQRGRKVGLSVARFTQVRGAKSSFEKVVQAVEAVVRNRGLLVEGEKAKGMAGCLEGR